MLRPCASQIAEASGKGAKRADRSEIFPRKTRQDSAYLAPQVLVDVDHSMKVMMEETFGPVVGIMKVESDDEAIALMNDSPMA